MSDEIQAEPPPRRSAPEPDELPDILLRKSPRQLRLWIISTMCYLCGVISHVFLGWLATGRGRPEMGQHACVEGVWYAIGLVTLLLDASADGNPTTRNSKYLACVLGAMVAFVLVLASLPS
jgi:hypothetical protein